VFHNALPTNLFINKNAYCAIMNALLVNLSQFVILAIVDFIFLIINAKILVLLALVQINF